MKKIVIFGLADTAQLAHYYFSNDSEYKVVAFTVDSKYMQRDTYCGLPVVPYEKIESIYPPQDYAMFIAVGYHELNTLRTTKYHECKQKGYEIVSYISSKAIYWKETVFGENCFILENNVIQPFVKIGNNVTIWSGNNIGHHSEIRDNCFITTHVAIAGRVMMDENCFVGVNATLGDYIKIAKNCIISAGSVVLYDTLESTIYAGSPAKPKKISGDMIKMIFKVQKRSHWELNV